MALLWTIVSSSLLRLTVLLGLLALLVRLKVKIGRVLIAAPVLAAVLFASRDLPASFVHATTRDGGAFIVKTLTLLALIGLINFFGALLKETERLPRLMAALQSLFKDARIALAGMPALIGFLPMPGGALLSAPMVEEVAKAAPREISPEDKSLVNYLFRHIWEYFLPVYPAILMSVVIWRVGFGELALRQLVLTFAAIAGALIFVLRPIGPLVRETTPKNGDTRDEQDTHDDHPVYPVHPSSSRWPHVKAVVVGVLPIAAMFALWYALRSFGADGPELMGRARFITWRPWGRVSLVVALVAVNAGVVLRATLSEGWVREHVRTALPFDMFLLMVGAMLFQAVMESSGAIARMDEAGRIVGGLAWELKKLKVPLVLVIFTLPFVAGILSGIAVFYVTVAFPILKELIGVGAGYDPAATTLAFAAGYAGVLLSPVHLCLLLTVQHFGARMGIVYRRLFAPVGVTVAVAFVLYFTTTRL